MEAFRRYKQWVRRNGNLLSVLETGAPPTRAESYFCLFAAMHRPNAARLLTPAHPS